MNDSSESTRSDETGQCNWCDGPVGLFRHTGEGVCGKCHGLLSGAGVSQDEIYGAPAAKVADAIVAPVVS